MSTEEERRNWRGITVNYDLLVTPTDTPIDCCYCLNNRQVQAILAMIEPLQWVTRYYSPADATIDKDLVDAFYAGIVEDLMGNCNDETVPGGVLHRFDPTTGLYQFSVDGGLTWQDSIDDPRISGTVFAPVSTGDTTKCDAAVNAKNQVAKLVSQAIAAKTAAEDYVAVVAIIASIIGGWFGLVFGALIVSIFAAVIDFLIATDAAALAAAFTDTTYNEVECLFFNHSGSDGRFDDTQRAALIAAIPTEITDSYARDFLAGLLPLLGVLGLNNMTAQGSSSGASCDCDDCPAAWIEWGTGSHTGCVYTIDSVANGGSQIAYLRFSNPAAPDNSMCGRVAWEMIAGTISVTDFYTCDAGTEYFTGNQNDVVCFAGFTSASPFTIQITVANP